MEIERDTDYKNERDSEDRDRESALSALDNKSGPASAQWQILKQELDDSDRTFNQHQLRVKREAQVSMYERWFFFDIYIWILIVLFAFELPINYTSFERLFTILRVHEALQILATVFVAILLILFAHVIGKTIKQIADFQRRPIVMLLTFFSVGALSVGLIYGLFELRDLTLQAAIEERVTPDTSQQRSLGQAGHVAGAQQGQDGGAQRNAGDSVLTVGSDSLLGNASGTLLLVLNLGVFLVAAILSFARHDKDPDLERAFFERRRAERRHAKFENAFNVQRGLLIEQFDGRGSVLGRWSDRIDSETRHLEDEVERLELRLGDETSIVDNVLEKRVLAYRQGNMDARNTPPPPYFNSPIDFKG